MPKHNHPEQKLHQDVRIFLDVALPDNAWWTTIDHGAQKGKLGGALLKARGAKPGIPDILIIVPKQRPIWIELKGPKGTPSMAQISCHQALRNAQCNVAICNSVEGVAEHLEKFLELKGRVAA